MPDDAGSADGGPSARILIVDDEPAIVDSLRLLLETAGYAVASASTGGECVEAVTAHPSDLVLLDLMLPDRPGLAVLREIRKIDRALPVLMLTAYGSIETAVEATRCGASNFLTKPWNNSKLLLEIRQALERSRLEAENSRLRRQVASTGGGNTLIGDSDAIARVTALIDQVAPSHSTVLVSGESGSGKELVARAIHAASPRADRPFVTVDSSSIPAERLDSALFGHVKGAFEGATRDRQGCFAVANGGTVFLDEVSTLSSAIQAKLLHVLEEREFVPVGSNAAVRADVRIVAATNEDLETAAEQGRFREDLYYRLNVIGIAVPPLRERKEDIPQLVDEFLNHFCRREKQHFVDRQQRATLRFTPEAHAILMAHDWPGNVRELRNAVECAVVLATGEELPPDVLPASVTGTAGAPLGGGFSPRSGSSLAGMVEDYERQLLIGELERHGFNQTETAKTLRVALSTLNQKIQRLGINVKRRRSD